MTLLAPDVHRPGPPPAAAGRRRLALPERLVLPALGGAAAGAVVFPLALLVTGDPLLAAGGALGCLVAALAFADPLVALLLFAGLEVSQTGAVLLDLGVPSPLVVTQVLAVGALGVALLRGRLHVPMSPVLLAALLLVATRAASVPTALVPDLALATVLSELKDLLTLAVTYALLVHTRGVPVLLKACVLVLAALAGLTVVQEYLLGNSTTFLGFSQVNAPDVGSSSSRHTGPIGDPNFWGRVLVMFLPFALALALASRRLMPRLFWAGSTVSLFLGIFLSQSRGAFLAAFFTVVVLLLLAGWQHARWLALTPVLVAGMFLLPGIGPRLQTLADLGQASQGGGDLSLVLRLASQEAGLRMFEQRPWLGVGAGGYEGLTPRFESGLSFATVGELGKPLAPHNSFLEYLAEGGLVGGLGLLVFLGALVLCALRALRAADRRGLPGWPHRDKLLAAAGLAAVGGWAVASVVLHARQFRTLLVLAAVIAALDALRGPQRPRRPLPRVPWRRYAAAWTVPVVLGGAGGLLLLGPVDLREQRWQASTTGVLAARGQEAGGLDAYRYDLLTRGRVVPTFASVLGSRSVLARSLQESGLPPDSAAVEVEVVTSPRSSDLLVRVRGRSQDQVRDVARQVATIGGRAVDRLETPFVLRPVAAAEVTTRRVGQLDLRVLGAIGGWLLLVAALAWTQLQLVHRRAVREAGQQA